MIVSNFLFISHDYFCPVDVQLWSHAVIVQHQFHLSPQSLVYVKAKLQAVAAMISGISYQDAPLVCRFALVSHCGFVCAAIGWRLGWRLTHFFECLRLSLILIL